MVRDLLTAEEEDRHRRGIAKIRRRLFRSYSPAEHFIVTGSERILSASAESCWNAACGTYRIFRFGGLTYEIDCADRAGLNKFSVTHLDADTFIFWVSGPQGHTISCLNVRFQDLNEVPHAYVHSCRRANLAPAYLGKKNNN